MLAWASRSGWPTSAASRSKRYHSRNTPARVAVLHRGDLVGALDAQRSDLHQDVAPAVQQAEQVLAVPALGQRLGQARAAARRR